jgi:3',5'-cyclic AMP phosphodiesterase CpdA
MATIAQLTDLHLLEDNYTERPFGLRARLSYLSFGRCLDPGERRKKVASWLKEARLSGIDHLVITGDLTEDGHPAQFEVLAELLADSRIAPERITIVPGNHDAYTDGEAFADAMRGPLKAYAPTSRTGVPLRFRDVTIVPVSTAFFQSPLRSAGQIADDELRALAAVASDEGHAGRPLVFAMHHPPGRHFLPIVQWIDGFLGHGALSALFERCPKLHVIHGHTHHHVNRSVKKGEAPRVFSAKAVVDGDRPLRLYEASPAGLSPLEVDLNEGLGEFALPA